MYEYENETDEERPFFRGPLGVLRIIGIAIGGVAMAVLLGFLFGWLVMWLWNTIMPQVFGLKVITYWQAFGLIILAKLFFGGHGWHGGHRNHRDRYRMWKKHWRRHKGDWDDWAPAGDYSNWRYYDEYWKNEGKTAFEAYLAKNREEHK